MDQDFLTGLGLIITLFTIAALLKVTVASSGSGIKRLLIAAWPLATLAGFGVALVLLPMGPDPSVEGLFYHFLDLLGGMGGIFVGLLGAFFTPQDRARGAGAGILILSTLLLSTGAHKEHFGGALLTSFVIAGMAGAYFFLRPGTGTDQSEKAARATQETSKSGSPARSPSADINELSRSTHEVFGSPAPRFTIPFGTPKLPPQDLRTALRAITARVISREFLTHILYGAAGAALMAVVVILAGGMAGEKILAAVLIDPLDWLSVPMLIGAAGGASLSLILRCKNQ